MTTVAEILIPSEAKQDNDCLRPMKLEAKEVRIDE